MKKIIFAIFAMALLAITNACTDETIGSSLTDTRLAVIEDSNFTVIGTTVPNKRLQARTSTQLIGAIKAGGYGTLRSEVLTQMMPTYQIDTVDVTIDSCRFRFRVPLENGFTGDSLAPMRMSIYRLNKQLTAPMFSDDDPSQYYDPADLIGSAPYSPASAVRTTDLETVTEYRAVYVPMPVSFAQELFDKFRREPEVFKSPAAFAQYFPGIYIANSFGSGRMMNFSRTEFEVFYSKHVASEDLDTIYTGISQVYMAASPEVLQDNIISLDVDPIVNHRISQGEDIVLAPAGYEVQIRFPINEILEHFKAQTMGDIAVINKLEMEIPVDDPGTQYNIAPPTNLLIVKTSMKDQFIEGDSLTNNKDSFYAKYSSEDKCYTFGFMRDYILNIINNKGGIATEEDINLTVTPVDITTYTTAATYYTSASTVVTKIAPQVSAPAIARLRFDKAKVKITFSRQSM